MKKRRYLTEVKGETDYYYDDTPKSNFTENRGEFGVGQLSDHNNPKSFREIDSSNYHIQEKYHKIKINKKDHEYLKGYKKNQEITKIKLPAHERKKSIENIESIKKQKLSEAVRDYLQKNYQKQQQKYKGRKLNSSQKMMWIEQLSKPKSTSQKYQNRNYMKLESKSLRKSILRSYKVKKEDRNIRQYAASEVLNNKYEKIKNINRVLEGRSQQTPPKRKHPNHPFKDSSENYYIFQKSCKLITYFTILKEKQESTDSQKQQLSVTNAKSQKILVPEERNIDKFIESYIPQSQININQLKNRKNFTVKFVDKNYLYFGEISHGIKNGEGIYVTNKYKHQGLFHNDEIVKGIEKKKNLFYRGQFMKGKKQGEGQCHWTNGQQYSGEWKNNKKHGNGYWKSSKGDTYLGEWKEGKAFGFGIYRKQEGSIYEGQFILFLKHGKGKQTFPNGDVYEGLYEEGEATGKGIYTWQNGIVYEGNFVNGKCSGIGILKYPKQFEFEGNFAENGPNGISRLKMGNGNVYNGMFRDGKIHGYGLMDNKRKRQMYEGYWIRDEMVSQID